MKTKPKETQLQIDTRRFDTDSWRKTREHKKRLKLEELRDMVAKRLLDEFGIVV